MKNKLLRWTAALVFLGVSSSSFAAEDWKGESTPYELSTGGLVGMGIIDGSAGISILGNIGKKVVNRGFAPDINDSVWIEAALGPVFYSAATAIAFSFHLRWDFQKDDKLTLYAIGGAGGNTMTVASMSRAEVYPRFGIGLFYSLNTALRLRAELSHEFLGVGLGFFF